jgi:hypothetical protein
MPASGDLTMVLKEAFYRLRLHFGFLFYTLKLSFYGTGWAVIPEQFVEASLLHLTMAYKRSVIINFKFMLTH